jgi:hypothetical protein
MSRIISPSQGRIAIGTVMVGGQRLEVTLNDEWARFFEAMAVRSSSSVTQISNLQSAVDASSVLGVGDGDSGGEMVPGPPGRDGATGATGPALGLLAADPEMPDMIPGPAGPPGPQGSPGPALFFMQENDNNDIFWPIWP